MPGRRSVSVEPEDLVVASPRRRSARIAIRTDSPAPTLKKDLASTPAKRTRRSLSIQEKSLNDIEKDVNAISHHSKSRTSASGSSASEQAVGGAARRTRRSASTQETHVALDDLKKDDKQPMLVKRSKRLLSKETSTDVIDADDDKPEATDDDDDDGVAELGATIARKRLTRSMSRSPTNTQKSKPSAPPVVKTFRSRLSSSDKHLEDAKPAVLDIITENEDEINDRNENDTDKPTLETDMLNNNAKKSSEDIKMQTDESKEESKSKPDLPAVGTGDGIIKSAGSEVQASELTANSEETVLNTSVKSTAVEETNITLNSTSNMDVADQAITEKLLANNEQNALNDNKTESMNMETDSAENMKSPVSSNKLDDSLKATASTEAAVNVSTEELNEAKNCDVAKHESESEKESTVNKINSVLLEKDDNSDLEIDIEMIDDSDPEQNEENMKTNETENKIDTEETIDKLEITQDEEMMDKLEINEESEEKSLNATLSGNTNENADKSEAIECTDSVNNESRNEVNEKVVAKPSENITTKEEEEETTKVDIEIEVRQNKVDTSELPEENKDPATETSKQVEVALPELNNSAQELVVVEVQSCEDSPAKQQSVTLDNNSVADLSPRKSEVNSEPVNKDASSVTSAVQDTPSDKPATTHEDDVTNISIVSADNKVQGTVDKCASEENCETNISIVDSPESNISSTPMKAASVEQTDSAKKEHERNLNLSLVNDDGSSYSPIINRIENISVDFEYSTSSIVDSSGAAHQEADVLTKNASNATAGDDVTKDSCQEQNETSLENRENSENSNKSNNTIAKEATISNDSFQSVPKQLNNSMKEVCEIDDSCNENVTKDESLNKSNRKTKILDTSSDENIDSSEDIEKIDLTKAESPKNEAISEPAKAQESAMESTEKCRDKILDDFIESFKAEKKRKRQSSDDDSIAERSLKQKKRRKHKTDLRFSSDSDETSDIEGSDRQCRTRDTKRNISDDESDDEESDEYQRSEFIDDMASEGSEETPSIDSNEIIDEGESVGSADSPLDSDDDDDYEHGSFVVDDDVGNEELLSGSEDVECWTPKRKRIITIASDTDDELDKMSMEPFGGSSPSLISINQISSVDSDLESIKCKNEALSKLIEAETKSDTEDVDVVIVNESMNKSDGDAKHRSNIEELSASILRRTEENIETNEKIQHLVEELQEAISHADDTRELEEPRSPLTEPVKELNTADEQEQPVEAVVYPDISEELVIVEENAVDESPNEEEMITAVAEPENEVRNEVENSIEQQSDEINSADTQERDDKEKDARYQAILDKYFKHFDNTITKSGRRRTVGVVESNEDTNNEAMSKRKRRQSLETAERNAQTDTAMFEALYNESKKAKTQENDMKREETEAKKPNSRVKRRTTDENAGIGDVGDQKNTLKPQAKRHSLTNIENIPGKYVQSPRQLSKSFTGFSSGATETEIIHKYSETDGTAESAAWMLKDFSDTVKDDIRAAKANVLSPKRKKSLNTSGVLAESLAVPTNTAADLARAKSPPQKPLLAVRSPVETLKRKKKHGQSGAATLDHQEEEFASTNNAPDLAKAKSSPQKPLLAVRSPVETLKRKKKRGQSGAARLDQEEQLATSVSTKNLEEVYTKTKKKKKKQMKVESNDINQCKEQADNNLEMNIKQGRNAGNNKKSKACIKLATAVGEIKAPSVTGDDIKHKHSNLSENTSGVQFIEHKNNKKARQMAASSKSFPKNTTKHPPLPSAVGNKFVVKKERATATKSEYEVVNDFLARRSLNIYKNLIRPSGRGTTGANIKVENLHAASITIKREKKKQKYNRKGNSKAADAPVASFTGQANCSNFKEEFLFGNAVKRVAVAEILKKKRSVK